MTLAPQVPTGILVKDSRRLTGPGLYLDALGAVIDAACPDERRSALVEAWRREARWYLDAVGWKEEALAVRLFPGGVSLAFSAPVDALYAATEVNEMAFRSAAARVTGAYPPDPEASAERLREVIADERNPSLTALRGEALRREAAFLCDDQHVSVGLGRGSRTWPVEKIPPPGGIPWERVHDIPVVLVTGSGGRTAAVRLLQAVAVEAGKTAGIACAEGIEVDGETLGRVNCTWPEGARVALRDRRAELAILETSRAGMVQRGLAVDRAAAAVVTGLGGGRSPEEDAAETEAREETGLIVEKAVRGGGLLVLNADDEALRRRGPAVAAATGWYSAGPQKALVLRHAGGGRLCAWRDGEDLTLSVDGRHHPLPPAGEVAAGDEEDASGRISSILAAATAASALGFTPTQIDAGLRSALPGRRS